MKLNKQEMRSVVGKVIDEINSERLKDYNVKKAKAMKGHIGKKIKADIAKINSISQTGKKAMTRWGYKFGALIEDIEREHLTAAGIKENKIATYGIDKDYIFATAALFLPKTGGLDELEKRIKQSILSGNTRRK